MSVTALETAVRLVADAAGGQGAKLAYGSGDPININGTMEAQGQALARETGDIFSPMTAVLGGIDLYMLPDYACVAFPPSPPLPPGWEESTGPMALDGGWRWIRKVLPA